MRLKHHFFINVFAVFGRLDQTICGFHPSTRCVLFGVIALEIVDLNNYIYVVKQTRFILGIRDVGRPHKSSINEELNRVCGIFEVVTHYEIGRASCRERV